LTRYITAWRRARRFDRPVSFELLDYGLGVLRALTIIGEGRAREVYVGIDKLLDERPEGVALLLDLFNEFLGHPPVCLGLPMHPSDIVLG
jgi:hypothetical protein